MVLFSSACAKMDFAPTDQISTETLKLTSDGLINATNGNYSLFKDGAEFNGVVDDNNCYVRQYFQMSDFAADDIVCGQKTEDPLYYSFTYTHSPDQSNSRYFWYVSYKIINGTNAVIDVLENKGGTLTEDEKQLLGENYFLRAFSTFGLVKLYAKAYTTGDPNTNLGVIIRESSNEPGQKARATVQETYDFVISDLKKSADLMTKSRGSQYASREAAWALLSRAYLYMADYDNALKYSDDVISSGRFGLETSDSYPNYFSNALNSNETIWCVAFNTTDNRGKFGSIASMIYSNGNSGWGEEFATYDYMNLLAKNPKDVRGSYIDTLFAADGTTIVRKNGIETFFIKKFSYQDGDPNLSSPVMLRLAEMYLTRAEAHAQKGDVTSALSDVNEIRRNRGLSNDLINSVPAGKTILDVVLDERRLELAFEGHRVFDVYRNKRNMERNYWGYHITGLTIGDITLGTPPSGYSELSINWDDSKIVYYIPIDEITTNQLCIQN